MAGQAKPSGNSEIAGDSEVREKKAALRLAGKRLPRNTGAGAEAAAPPAEQRENGVVPDAEARANAAKRPSRKRRQSDPQGDAEGSDAVMPEVESVNEADGSDSEFLGVRRKEGRKAFAYLDNLERRHELNWLDVIHPKAAEMPEAGEEALPPSTIKHSDILSSVVEEADDFGDGSWRPGLEELRRTQKPKEPPEISKEKPSADDLLRMVDAGIRRGEWKPVVEPATWPTPPVIGSAVEQLREDELLHVLRACHEHVAQHPTTETGCFVWIDQVLQHASLRLAGRANFREAARPLLQLLARRLGPAQPERGIGACVGRWRLVLELARLRRQVSKPPEEIKPAAGPEDAAAPAVTRRAALAAAAAKAAEPSSEEEDSDDAGEEDSAEEEEADEDAADGKDGGGAGKSAKALAGVRAGSASRAQPDVPRKRLRSQR